MQDYTKNLAQNITENRKRNNLSQEKLAEKLGVSYETVKKWELGISSPDISLLPQISALFNISIDTLLGSENIMDVEVSLHENKKTFSNQNTSESGSGSGSGSKFSDTISKFTQAFKNKVADPLKNSVANMINDSEICEVNDLSESIDLKDLPEDSYTFVIYKGKKPIYSRDFFHRVKINIKYPIENLTVLSSTMFENLCVTGNIKIDGPLKCKGLSAASINAKGDISCDNINLKTLTVNGNINCNNITCEDMNVTGSINSTSILGQKFNK